MLQKKLVFNILVNIESLSHVLNNVPLLFTTTLNIPWFLLSMCESVSPKMVGADVFWIIQGELYPASHQHPSLSLGKA